MLFPKRTNLILLLLVLTLSITGCATTFTGTLPPILTQDEIACPYNSIGKIQVSRDVYGPFDYNITPAIREWGRDALRAEAGKMGADAVIFPEISGNSFTFIFIPSTEYRAVGEAIKFKK